MKTAYNDLVAISKASETVRVGISNEVVALLSQQLYQSPLKAIEELVVNSYDADANFCRLFIPDATSLRDPKSVIAIFDDGLGLSDKGMKNLWHVGRSDKRTLEIEKCSKRKQIGKFGIGKLAVFVISNQLSYVSKSDGKIWFSSLDFTKFHSDTNGSTVPVEIELRSIETLDDLQNIKWFSQVMTGAGVTVQELRSENWTFARDQSKRSKWRTLAGCVQGSAR